ncbi:MAG TPA: twin-arginine translocase TatA/TatE family subunit [Roseiflexaceae bacterium]
MNFLGVGPGELLLIFILMLVVVGPDRLPGLARQFGRWLVSIRNWMQNSPDAAVVLRARQEIEQELALLKSSLLEVQSVRDEVLGAAKQLNEAVSPLTTAVPSLNDLLTPPAGTAQTVNANGQAAAPMTADELTAAAGDSAAPAPEIGVPEIILPEPDASETAAMDTDAPEIAAPAPVGTRAGLTTGEIEEFSLRIQAVMADLYALQEQLKQRGLLDADWQPPSWNINLPVPQPGTHTEEADG